MRTSIIAGLCFAFMTFGITIGAMYQSHKDVTDVENAWDDITVVADGTLIPNPSAYAWNPDELANASNVRIISKSKAAAAVAMNGAY